MDFLSPQARKFDGFLVAAGEKIWWILVAAGVYILAITDIMGAIDNIWKTTLFLLK